MRNIISLIILLISLAGWAPVAAWSSPTGVADQATVKVGNRQTATATVTQETGVIEVETAKQPAGGFLAQNWGILSLSLLSFLEVITRLTPSAKDNTVLTFVSRLLNAIIPNVKKGGGRL